MTKRTLHSRNLDLLPLRTVLLAAEQCAPPRLLRRDSNERLASQLILKMKAGHELPNPFEGLTIESPQPMAVREMVESHA